MTLMGFDEALQTLLQHIDLDDRSENVPLSQACRRVLAKPVKAGYDAPPFDNSAMDGYAVAGLEAGRWKLVDYVAAGEQTDHIRLEPGQAVRIFTGAAVPQGTDAVVPQEQVTVDDDGSVTVGDLPRERQHIRFQAEEFSQNDELLAAGSMISAAGIGLIASQGLAEVSCRPQLDIAVFSNGNELQALGQPLGPNQIYDSNRYMMLAALQAPLWSLSDGGVLPDDLDVIKSRLREATQNNDVVILSGGTSVGEKDYVRMALEEEGDLQHWKLAIKPGKPFAWGRMNRARVFLLPGNPVAAWVTLRMLVLPALHKMLGIQVADASSLSVKAVSGFTQTRKQPRRQFLRGILQQQGAQLVAHAFESKKQSSAMMLTCTQANALIIVPENTAVAEGDELEAIWLPDNYAAGLQPAE